MFKGNSLGLSGRGFGILALTVAAATAACTKTKKPEETSQTASTTANAEKPAEEKFDTKSATVKGVDVERKAVALNFSDEPKIMDAQKADDAIAIMLLGHVMEGLTRLDPKMTPVPGVAESWEQKSPTEFIFKLRKNSLWSDGKPVTAKDFEYAWKRGLDPKTASPYAFILFPLKNAHAVNEGKMEVDKVGVKATDEYTLSVQLESPTGYFLRLLSFATWYPARKDFVESQADKYAADSDKMLYNGPFTISEWKHNASMKLTKNEKYWNKDQIGLNEINFPYLIRDENSEYNMFKDGKYAMMLGLSKELLPDAQSSKFQIRKYNVGTVWYLQLNTTRKVTGNKNFRKALQFAMDRNEYTTQINGIPGAKPIYAIIPEYMPGVEKTYGEEYPLAIKDADIAQAKKYLDAAKKELGITEFPEIGILASDSNTARRDMEYFQRFYKEKLGLNIKLDFQTFKVRLERTDRKDFDIVYSGWGPDYLDAMTFADLFTSWNGNNNTGWKSAAYDKHIKTAMGSDKQKVRTDAMFAAEKILVEEAPIVPIFQASRVYVQDPRLTGVIRSPAGMDPDFYYAKIVDNVANAAGK